MFTISQIKASHSKVKTGADFPAYVQELIGLGVVSYDTYVIDGHTDYFGKDNFVARSDRKYPDMKVAEISNRKKFQHYLKIHQEGQTDYLTFCNDSAGTGIEKWTVNMSDMICTYYGKGGTKILEERLPAI